MALGWSEDNGIGDGLGGCGSPSEGVCVDGDGENVGGTEDAGVEGCDWDGAGGVEGCDGCKPVAW